MTTPPSVYGRGEDTGRTALAERRRSRRRRLHEPREVSIHGTCSGIDWACSGVLLNASADGIACRALAQNARALTIGRTVRVVFRLGPASADFDFKVRVTNITPAGTTHSVVLGMAFVADRRWRSLRTKLLEALRRAGDGAN